MDSSVEATILLHAAELVDGEELAGKFVTLDAEFHVAAIEVVVELVGLGKLGAVDRLEDVELQSPLAFAPVDRRLRDIRPPPVLSRVADRGRVLGEFVHRVIPVDVEEPVQALRVVEGGIRGECGEVGRIVRGSARRACDDQCQWQE